MAAVPEWRAQVDFLALLGEPQIAGAWREVYPAGTVAEYPTEGGPDRVIESGLVRAFQVSEDGREATIGYLYPGEFVGALPSLPPRPVVYIQALLDTAVLRLPLGRLREAREGDFALSQALAVHTATILARVVRVVTVRTLGTLRQRVAFDLLERASAQAGQSTLTCRVTHEQIANAVGSAREVVGRALGLLSNEAIIATAHGRITIRDPARLSALVQGLVV